MIVGIAIGAAVLLGGTIMVAHEFMFILDRVRTNAPVARDSVKAPTPPAPATRSTHHWTPQNWRKNSPR